jgi:hypothetical protein
MIGRLATSAAGSDGRSDFETDLLCALPPLCSAVAVGIVGCKSHLFVRRGVQSVSFAGLLMLGGAFMLAISRIDHASKTTVVLLLCASMSGLWVSGSASSSVL